MITKECPFSEYEYIKFLGKGANGEVFKCRRKDNAIEECAVKEIHLKIRDYFNDLDSVDVKKVLQEVNNILTMGTTANIVPILQYTTPQISLNDEYVSFAFRMYVYDFLDKELELGLLSEREVITLGIDIGRALSWCHTQNIIHRDVKPSNIFIANDGTFLLGDFGAARFVDGSLMTKIGTPGYWAPEVDSRKYSFNADIYSLGIVLYEALAGYPYYDKNYSSTPKECMLHAIQQRYDNEGKLPRPDNISDALWEVICNATKWDPNERYQDAEQMVDDLEAINRGDISKITDGIRYYGEYPDGKGGCLYDNGRYWGNWVAGKRSGHGEEYDSNDRLIYDGEWKNDSYHGMGEKHNYDTGLSIFAKWNHGVLEQIEHITLSDGTKIYSKWDKDELISDKATIYYSNNSIYYGSIDNEYNKNGYGIFVANLSENQILKLKQENLAEIFAKDFPVQSHYDFLSNCLYKCDSKEYMLYEGMFENNNISNGTLCSLKFTYTGDFVDYKRAGKGECAFYDEYMELPVAVFVSGIPNNIINLQTIKTDICCHNIKLYSYSGYWNNDYFCGIGNLKFGDYKTQNQAVGFYAGEFDLGKPNGHGYLSITSLNECIIDVIGIYDKFVYSGEWNNGLIEGKGLVLFDVNNYLEGEFHESVPCGKCTYSHYYTSLSCRVDFSGIWNSGLLSGESSEIRILREG